MSRYLTAIFSDLESSSLAWSRAPREVMAEAIAEYRGFAEALADRHGATHVSFTGDGHLFLFQNADLGAQFGLRLVDGWERLWRSRPRLNEQPPLALRVGCHFGDCEEMPDGGWVGRAINLAKRVEGAAEGDSVYVTENVLELIDLALYGIEEAGTHVLKGDHLPRRALYRIAVFHQDRALGKPPSEMDADDWFLKALSHVGTAHEHGAEEARCYEQAIRLNPAHAEAHNNLGVVLRRQGDAAGAARHYREALRLRSDYPDAHYNYALLLEATGRAVGAEEHFRQALQLRAEHADAHHAYANLLRARGEAEAARGHYETALALRPGSAEIHNNFAILLEDLGAPEEAERRYLEALRLRPDYAEAHYNFALFLEDRARPRDAERHYREALQVREAYPEAHNNLAALLHAAGEAQAAKMHYLRALELRPEDPETHYNLGLLLHAEGETAAAREQFRLAHELAPETPAFRSPFES